MAERPARARLSAAAARREPRPGADLDRRRARRRRSRRQAARHRFSQLLRRLRAGAAGPRGASLRRRGALGGAEGGVRPCGRLFRLLLSAALSARLPAARASPLFRLADRLAGGDRLRLLARVARLGRAALRRRGSARLPRLPGQRRPRAERLSERGADRRRRAAGSTDGRSSPACCSARSSTSRNWR